MDEKEEKGEAYGKREGAILMWSEWRGMRVGMAEWRGAGRNRAVWYGNGS